jgi:hypothetical protein
MYSSIAFTELIYNPVCRYGKALNGYLIELKLEKQIALFHTFI